ncbi:MAG: GNAT family N-acetyltransferase [Microbacteriaceae bacterium]|nr:GNAT family N-acetyltransferase [Microbacteriaceae bacterium]
MSAVVFRPVTGDDVATVLDIYNHYIHTSTVTFDLDLWSEHDMAHKIDAVADLGMPFVIAERDGDVVGYAYLSTFREKAAYNTTMENTLYLRDDARGLGLGRLLLAELMRLGSESGVREVIAVIANTADAAPSIRLHENAGFVRVGEMDRVGRKFDEWVGVVMMQKSLSHD